MCNAVRETLPISDCFTLISVSDETNSSTGRIERSGNPRSADLSPAPSLRSHRGIVSASYIVCHSAGTNGVDLFFVLSGFLITGILIDSRDRSDRWTTFFARRSLRIFPLYFLTLFIVFVLLPDFLKMRTLSQYQIWAWLYVCNIGYTFGYCPDFGHLWSLAVEEQFYLVWPFCVWSVRSHRGVAILSGMTMLLAVATRIVALQAEVFPAFFTLCRLDSLAAGSLVAALVRMP